MGLVKIAKRKDVEFEYNDGYAEVEVLKGEITEAIFKRCSLLPGTSIAPDVYSTMEHTQVFLCSRSMNDFTSLLLKDS